MHWRELLFCNTNFDMLKHSSSSERDAEARQQTPSSCLRTCTPRASEEMDMHPVGLGVRVYVDFNLREQANRSGRQPDRHHTTCCTCACRARRCWREWDAAVITQPRQNKIDEGSYEVPHLFPPHLYLRSDLKARPYLKFGYPSRGPNELYAFRRVLTTGVITLPRHRLKLHSCWPKCVRL